MAWPRTEIADWSDFLRIAQGYEALPSALQTAYLHRGQSDQSWPLKSTLQRSTKANADAESLLKVEKRLLQTFHSHAHLHLRSAILPRGLDRMEWWALMQHYGAPTRLLDWTASIYVAAYFAVVDNWDADGAIWTFYPGTLAGAALMAIDPGRVSEMASMPLEKILTSKRLDDPKATPPVVFPMTTQRHSVRSAAQQGHFTIPTNPAADQEELITQAHETAANLTGKPLQMKHVIPHVQKPSFLRHLVRMNVNAVALFPGPEGLGRSLHDLARLELSPAATAGDQN